MKNKYLFLLPFFFLAACLGFAQGSTEYTGGMKVNLNEDGSKYFRIISWAQFWAQHSDNETLNSFGNEESDLNFSIRRARVLMYAQVSKRFLILTHFGLNSQNASNLHPVGKSDSSQLFFHDVWGEWSLNDNHAVGGGLHYWNGISRLNNQSTLNMLTLDNNRQSWATIGLSDQFARHMGVYFKGKFDRLQYRVSINEALTNGLDVGGIPGINNATYNGREILGGKDAGKNFAGYFDYQLLDQESNFLPYKVGSYLGSKKVFNVGAGFFYHPNGSVSLDGNNNFQGEDVAIFAVDAFYDAPVGDKGAAITAYATYQNNDYGTNFTLGQTYETGSMLYAHVGYVLPSKNDRLKLQPYLSVSSRNIDAIDDNANRFGIGGNLYFSGHHSKLSLEYANQKYGNLDAVGTVTLQAMIYL
ncbi:hypothetical protein LX97_00294 [Nonlabens dokdonensis]|jgi:hypothetical protein|uniref:Short chain amide porin n=2 Tax=Nonlabens dokdonensis TaxID=328515 RepID=L7W5Y2_NONDD|nr:hypothetical protein [Nonlabens dokdonensis]AGC75602.1 hypothetical protein DDD_0475 [Nonlabens dokdonensis DSW-6]PZX43294.1 hypothetical protein LX97_00294 [Nonlabens dokdonensis]